MKKPIIIEAVRALAEAGAISHVRLIASPDGMYVEINDMFVVANRLREIRYFAKSDTCMGWLKEVGISKVNEVDLSHWG